ncbi:uncharacterized protein LOC132301767 [Cornus florida]|uniref:uncharacterized protein LOC132301767 n=1 Tax=Cornus florida TaxID=4283 RepID=UPI0028964771|nr:uncharacterized protein LOC132301767 [Cornus florida]
MADSLSVEMIMEARKELMVPPTGGNPTLRTAHFLNPTLNSSIRDLPSLSIPTISELDKTLLKIEFKGRPGPQNGWNRWVERLQSEYQHVWKKAGIYDAILASTYQILRHNDLVIQLAQRWCVDTNTFIFPWGEATITLEDMVVLGGYSVLGDPVFNPLPTLDMIKIEEHLNKAYREIRQGRVKIVGHYVWMERFMESDDPFEHEAFLALWLSRYVFPFHGQSVGRNAFPIAIHLSRGTPIALAPAVLASIYSDLTWLKKSINALRTNCEWEDDDRLSVSLWGPFHLVQLWAWERFPTLRPNPNPISCGEPRMARWYWVKRLKVENVGMAMDSASECFQWRPYATVVNNWMFSKFYREIEEWVLVESDMDKELESFARCLRACELVGLDCIEQYLPHRVAMQFGMDQDVPGYVTRSNQTPEIAWRNYNRPIMDAELYIPYRLFESDVTKRYSEWWKQSMLASKDAIKGVVRQQRSKTYKRLPRVFRGKWNDNHDFVPSGFSSKRVKVEDVDEDKLTITELLRHYDFLPGFPPKLTRVEDVDEDKLTIAEKLRFCYEKHNSFQDRTASDHKLLPTRKSQNSSTSDVVNGVGRNMESLVKPIEMSMQDKTLMGRPKGNVEDADVSEGVSLTMRVYKNGDESFRHEPDKIRRLELEDRISKLEKLVGELKAANLGNSLEKNLL